MIEKTLVVTNEEGLHTRPANQFVKVVKAHQASVTLTKDNQEAPGKSLLKLMKLGIVKGETVKLVCDGPDEGEALDALAALLAPKESA